ncbi:MAG TPA: patatin-like phospholipase family protein [Acidimicrobiales bacterium]|nr:patatin-like phospholipase family protein [Acidimicrobiales bacterium]
MASVALVLGGGGIAGAAWHGAVLAALQEAGWDARTADLVVGTSAGAGVAAVLRLGVPPVDLVAGALGRSMSPAGEAHAARAGAPVEIPTPPPGRRLPRPAAPHLLLRAVADPWRFRPLLAMAALLPAGQVPTDVIGDRIRRTHDEPWPERPTWITAVRLRDGRRAVFGRDVEADLATAVEASSAIPGWFAPVRHDGVTYVDGGVHSPTNADLVAGAGFDVVVVSSPMSATREALRTVRFRSSRGLHAATLAREVAEVRAEGTPVLVLQPGPEVVDAVGPTSMDPSRRGDVARVAHETVAAHLRNPVVAHRLAQLRS